MAENWSEEELKAAVEAYVEMHRKEANNISFVKKQYYRALANRFNRTEKSFAYRMQNISYIYSLMGRNWLSGLNPAKHVGTRVANIIEKLIYEAEGNYAASNVAFEVSVRSFQAQKNLPQPKGIKLPSKTYSSTTSFSRDPQVKAWVLQQANGKCECCDKEAPFLSSEGKPFLETHHLRRLTDGGSDTISNVVALCPNCHREMHYGYDKKALKAGMYAKIHRLLEE